MGKKLLVADESPTIHKIISLTLASEGYEIASTKNAPDTLRKIDDWKPELLILDASLGETNGLELCKVIREKGYDEKTLPILILHGSFDEFDTTKLNVYGAQGSLLKPFDTTQLMDVLQNLGKEPTPNEDDDLITHEHLTPKGSPAFGSDESWDWDKETDEISVTNIRSETNILDSDETAANWELSENSKLSQKLAKEEEQRKPNLVFDAKDWTPQTENEPPAETDILEPSEVDEDKTQVFLDLTEIENSPSFELDEPESTTSPEENPTGGFELPDSALSDEPPSSTAKPFEHESEIPEEIFSEPPKDISAEKLVEDLTKPTKEQEQSIDENIGDIPDLNFNDRLMEPLTEAVPEEIVSPVEVATPPLSPEPVAKPVNADEMKNLISENLQQTLERIAWEVVPELAEKIIREEIQKILNEQDSNDN